MQDTSKGRDFGDLWYMEPNNMTTHRSISMLWNRHGEDGYSRWGIRGEMMFTTAEEAIQNATNAGFEYEVLYTGIRYHQQKSYSDNFQFKPEEVSDCEEEDIKF